MVGNTYKVFFYNDPEDAAVGVNTIKAKKPIACESRSSFPTTGQIGMYYLDESTDVIYSWNAASKEYEQTDFLKELKDILNKIENENQPIIIEKTEEGGELIRCYETYSVVGKELVVLVSE